MYYYIEPIADLEALCGGARIVHEIYGNSDDDLFEQSVK
jgi:hypothetical protein